MDVAACTHNMHCAVYWGVNEATSHCLPLLVTVVTSQVPEAQLTQSQAIYLSFFNDIKV